MNSTSTFRIFPRLETRRLTLKEITLDDLDWYMRHFNKKEIVVGSGHRGPSDLETARKEMELYITGLFRQGKGFRWGLVLRGSRDLIGSCGFYSWHRDDEPQADMGYDLDPNYWRRGLMTEALTEIIWFGFERMKLYKIRCLIMPTNIPSMNLIEKLGFKKQGIVRECTDAEGKLTDDVVFLITTKEWNSMQLPH